MILITRLWKHYAAQTITELNMSGDLILRARALLKFPLSVMFICISGRITFPLLFTASSLALFESYYLHMHLSKISKISSKSFIYAHSDMEVRDSII